MKLFKLLPIAVALIAPVGGIAQQQKACSRDSLKKITDLYITAQTKGDRSGLPFIDGFDYKENMKDFDINKGIINKPMKIDFHRSIYDAASCQTFTEVIHDTNVANTTRNRWIFRRGRVLMYSGAKVETT